MTQATLGGLHVQRTAVLWQYPVSSQRHRQRHGLLMASEALGAIVYQDIGEGCSCERCELSASWRPPIPMTPTDLLFTNFIFHFDGGTNGCRAGGRRPA
eukprot:6135870-Prymnesium_polylepis.1